MRVEDRMTAFDEIDASGCAAEPAARRAVEALRRGDLLAHPTETVYGLGGAATPAADERLSNLKERGWSPIIRLISSSAAARRLFPAIRWSERAERLARAFWPGPLTLVVDDGTEHGIALRAEAHPVVRHILTMWGGALSSTSLNVSGAPSACSDEEARAVLQAMPECGCGVTLVAAGVLPGPPPSTLVSLRGEEVRVLREGRIESSIVLDAVGREARA
jgi:L-threonylcarbamoyladenylate synthase